MSKQHLTKYRNSVFDVGAIETLRTIFENVCRDFESPLVEMNGEQDHVHLLIRYPPKVTVSKLVNSLKGVSSRLLPYFGKNAPISPHATGKGVPCRLRILLLDEAEHPSSVLGEYIEQQATPSIVRLTPP